MLYGGLPVSSVSVSTTLSLCQGYQIRQRLGNPCVNSVEGLSFGTTCLSLLSGHTCISAPCCSCLALKRLPLF